MGFRGSYAPHFIQYPVAFTLVAAHLTARNYAGLGYTYDADRDAFVPPKPYASWVLNEALMPCGKPLLLCQKMQAAKNDTHGTRQPLHGWRCKMGLNAFTVLGNTAKMTAACYAAYAYSSF
jgi:hypothetical protein